MCTTSIQYYLLNAEILGQVQVEVVDQRLIQPADSTCHVDFNAALHRNNAHTFSSLTTERAKAKKQPSRQIETFYSDL